MNILNNSTKTILITGGTHGIGKATAEKFYQNGWQVFICASAGDDLRGPAMIREMDGLHYDLADVTDEAAVQKLIGKIIRISGHLDAAFNNAGIGCAPMMLHQMQPETAGRVIDVNLMGSMICMKHEILAMLNQKTNGVIINNSSISAFRAGTGADYSYSASKAGILALTRDAAACPAYLDKIRFHAIVPGYIETRMTAADDKNTWTNRIPGGKAQKPEQAAELVYSITSNPALSSGQILYSEGGALLI